jgi:hypothetical protein
MLELLKIAWDVVVLRDGARKGQLTRRVLLAAAGFAVLEYAIGLPAILLYDKHPQLKPLFIAAMMLVAVNLVLFLIFGFRWYRRVSAATALAATAGKDN